MTFSSTAQTLYVIDPISPASQLPAADTKPRSDSHAISEHRESPLKHLMHEMTPTAGTPHLEVAEPMDIEIVVEEIPGAPPGTKDPEPLIEVMEEPLHAEEKDDSNDAKKSGKGEKWDWSKNGPHGFVAWIKERLDSVPKHSGFDTSGLERAASYLEKLDNEISKAMRMDLDGDLDANKVEEIRAKLDEGLARLHSRIDKVKDSKKSNKRKKKSEYIMDEDGFVKEAQKITGVQGVYVMMPLFISSLARICVNGMVSAGHDIEDMSNHLIKKYKLNDREQLELRQALFDMGLAMRVDMGRSPDEDVVVDDDKGLNWAQNYPG